MKRLLTAFTLLFCLSAMAEDFSLYIINSASETTTYAVTDLQKITFESGNVVVTTTAGTSTTVSISDIAKMYFDTSSAEGIDAIRQSAISFDGTAIHFAEAADKVNVYTVSGTLVATGSQLAGTSLSLSDMPDGVYVVSIDGKSFKVIKQ